MADSGASSLASAIGLLYASAVSAFGIRVWTRYTARCWKLEDYTYTIAFLLAIFHAILILLSIVHGYGRRIQDIPEPELDGIELSHYTAQFLYVLSFGLGRIACALLLGILAQASPLLGPARTTAALSGIWSVAAVLCLAFTGSEGKPWTGIATQSLFFRWLGIETTGILLELSVFGLSASIIWNAQMDRPRRLQLTAVFGVRLFLIPIIAARLVFLQPYRKSVPAWSAATPTLLTEAALAASVVVGCVTARRALAAAAAGLLQPAAVLAATTSKRLSKSGASERYYRLDHLDNLQSSSSGGGGGGGKGHRWQQGGKRWAGWISSRDTSRRRPRGGATTPDLAWKPYQGFSASEATAYPPRVHISSSAPRRTRSSRDHRSGRNKTHTASSSLTAADNGTGKTELPPRPMTIQRRMEVTIEYT
ncbi:hypothetical protein V2A60_002690 [Cordyceps javanica]